MSSKDGEEVKFWEEGTTGNFMFYQFYGGIHNIEPTIRITKRFDTVLQESFLKDERVDLFKLDVQGSELVVLQGATKLLQEATFVQLESSAIEYNKGGHVVMRWIFSCASMVFIYYMIWEMCNVMKTFTNLMVLDSLMLFTSVLPQSIFMKCIKRSSLDFVGAIEPWRQRLPPGHWHHLKNHMPAPNPSIWNMHYVC